MGRYHRKTVQRCDDQGVAQLSCVNKAIGDVLVPCSSINTASKFSRWPRTCFYQQTSQVFYVTAVLAASELFSCQPLNLTWSNRKCAAETWIKLFFLL
jgi:hypothetical protein